MGLLDKIQELKDVIRRDYGLDVHVEITAYPFTKGNEYLGNIQAARQIALAMAHQTDGNLNVPGKYSKKPCNWFQVDGPAQIYVHYQGN